LPNRIIKESIRTSDTLASVSAEAERLFWRLVVSADDYGRFDARTNIVLGQCMSAFLGTVTPEQIEKWMRELERAGLIQLYEVDGRRYLCLTKWDKHQRTRAKDSKFPPPEDVRGHPLSHDSKRSQATTNVVPNVFENEYENENEIYASSSDGSASVQIELSVKGGAQSNETGRGLDEAKEQKPPAEKPGYTEEFEAFWRVYPRRKEKQAAFKAWCARIRQDKADPNDLIRAAERYAAECKRRGTAEEYIKHAKTFLGPSKPYEDYLQPAETTQDKPLEISRGPGVVPLEIKRDPNKEELEWRRRMLGGGT
jgi:hypothetical protein